MQERIKRFLATADYLEDEQATYVLGNILARYEEGKFLVPFVGQFSAGKSMLINRLLGRNLLPTKGIETTAVLTYIFYGEEEKVEIETFGGERKALSFAELLMLNQVDSHIQQLADVKVVEVTLKHKLLEKGLVLVDTPGLNTLLRNHEEMTCSLLPQAQLLIYVIGKSLGDGDLTLLNKMHKLGIELVVVRTKLDDLKNGEESPQQAMEQEEGLLCEKVGNVPYFGVTSDHLLLEEQEWQERIGCLKKYLEDCSNQISLSSQVSLDKRLKVFEGEFECRLREKKEILENFSQQTREELLAQIAEVDFQISNLLRQSRTVAKEVENQCVPLLNELNATIHVACEENSIAFEETLVSTDKALNDRNETKRLAEQYLKELADQVENISSQYLEKMVGQSEWTFKEGMQEIRNKLQEVLTVPVEFNLSSVCFSTIDEDRSYLLNLLERQKEDLRCELIKKEDELTSYGVKQQDVLQFLEELQTQSGDAKERLDSLGKYIPQYVDIPGDSSMSEILATVGKIADLAMIFVPGKAIVSGAQAIKVGANAAKVIKSGVEVIENVGKLKKVADGIKSTLIVGKEVQNKLKSNIPHHQAGLLDYLTLEYYFRKAGTLFDTPTNREVDKSHQQSHQERRQELIEQYRQVAQREAGKLEEFGIIQSRQERVQKEQEILQRQMKELDNTLAREKATIEKRAKIKNQQQFIQGVAADYARESSQYCNFITAETGKIFQQLAHDKVISLTLETDKQLRSLQSSLQQLSLSKNKKESDVTLEISLVDNLIADLSA